jgi:hypothetical protein
MEFPEDRGSRDFIPEPPKHIMESSGAEDTASDDRSYDDRSYVDDTAQLSVSPASDHLAGDVISLDAMRDNLRSAVVTNFQQDDLDVPAFLRKRNEVM